MSCDLFTSYFPKVLTVALLGYTGTVAIQHVNVVPFTINAAVIVITLGVDMYTYFKIVSVGAGSPLDFPELHIQNVQDAEEGHVFPPEFLSNRSVTLKHNGRFRICRNCKVWKPDRSHHCSSCNKCFLKMDHHCPWFASCIGFKNQKLFIQFLLYTTWYAVFVFMTTGLQLWKWLDNKMYEKELIDLSLMTVWLLSIISCISMFAFTSYSIYLVTKNTTTIEMYGWTHYRSQLEIVNDSRRTSMSATDNVFDLGTRKANWEAVMGKSWREWLLPVRTDAELKSRNTLDEKGLYFKIRSDIYQDIHESMDLQQQLMKRLTPRSSTELRTPMLSKP